MTTYTPPAEAVEAFKAAWHEADAEGDVGNRVLRGLAAAGPVIAAQALSETADVASNDVCEHQNANYLRMMSERDALRAEVERLREVSAAQPYETERELAVALDEARQQLADLRAGIEALADTKPGATGRALRALLAGSGEQPGEADRAAVRPSGQEQADG